MLVEVQALVSTSSYGNARRMASGLDQNRLSLLLAVLEKRAGLNLIAEDVFVNVAGGIDRGRAGRRPRRRRRGGVERPQSARAGRRTAVFGEVGLAGEVRGVSQAALRVREAAQMGFTRCVVPGRELRRRTTRRPACELVGVRTVSRGAGRS